MFFFVYLHFLWVAYLYHVVLTKGCVHSKIGVDECVIVWPSMLIAFVRYSLWAD